MAFHLGFVVRISNGLGREIGRDDRFDEPARLGEQLGRRGIDRHVEAEHRAERADRIAVPGLGRIASPSVAAVAAPQGLLCLITATAGRGKRADDRQRAVEIEQVVVRQFFAVELLGADERVRAGVRRSVERPPVGAGFRRSEGRALR